MTEEQYIQKGFNAGYQLEQHQPKLAAQLQKGFVDKNHPYTQGFTAGRQEYIQEMEKSKTPYLDSLIQRAKEKQTDTAKEVNKDRSKGIDL